jgi:hypothetical protein
VGFVRDYASKFRVIRRTNVAASARVGTVYVNELATSVTTIEQLPYPYGSVIVFEWAETEKDAAGAPIVGPNGLWRRTGLAKIDVMRRETGFGEIYGADRAGDWEFATYKPDGVPMKTSTETLACAKCHRGAAVRDFVFRGRFPEMETK